MVYRVGICDDINEVCLEFERYVKEFFRDREDDVEVYIWNDGETLKKDLTLNLSVDMLFLDIELPKCNGVSVGKFIREELQNDIMDIVYVSAKTRYAMELFETHPYDFLVKPVGKNEVLDILSKAFKTYV